MKTKKTDKRTRVFDSIASASAQTGISIESLRNMKERGCPAFRGSRVHEDALFEWMGEHEGEIKTDGDSGSLKDQKTAEEIRKLRIKNDRDEGKLIPLPEIVRILQAIQNSQLKILRQRLEKEYPTAVVGMDVPGAIVYGKRLVNEICKEMQKIPTEWKSNADNRTEASI